MLAGGTANGVATYEPPLWLGFAMEVQVVPPVEAQFIYLELEEYYGNERGIEKVEVFGNPKETGKFKQKNLSSPNNIFYGMSCSLVCI